MSRKYHKRLNAPQQTTSFIGASDQQLIERQSRSIFIVAHAGEIISGVNVSCPTKKELLEGFGSARTQRINDATERDLYKKPFCARNRYKLEVVWKCPRPIRNEVILRQGHVRVAAGHHLGKIAMHDADAAGKVRHLRCEELVGRLLSDQIVDCSTVPGASSRFANRLRQ